MLSAALLAACNGTAEGPSSDSDFQILNGNPVEVSPEGGSLVLEYRTALPAGGYIEAESEATWITYADFSPTAMTATFEIEQNIDPCSRRADIILTYIYATEAGTDSASDTISVLQSGVEVPYDYIFEATYFTGEYYGNLYGNDGEINYSLILADAPGSGQNLTPGGIYYLLDIFSTEPANLDAMTLPAGTYTLGEPGETAYMTFTPDYTYWFKVNSEGSGYDVPYTTFVSGTLEVSYQDGVCTYDADLTDNIGKRHKLTYRGDGIYRNGLIESTLEGDVDVNTEGMGASAIYYGDYYMNGTTDWFIIMANPDGEVLQLDICTQPGQTFEDGLPSGSFTASTLEFGADAGEFVPGYVEGNCQATWYYNENQDGMITDPIAPLKSGRIDITRNADGTYTIKVNCGDDAYPANTVRTEWTGKPVFSDESWLAPAKNRGHHIQSNS